MTMNSNLGLVESKTAVINFKQARNKLDASEHGDAAHTTLRYAREKASELVKDKAYWLGFNYDLKHNAIMDAQLKRKAIFRGRYHRERTSGSTDLPDLDKAFLPMTKNDLDSLELGAGRLPNKAMFFKPLTKNDWDSLELWYATILEKMKNREQ
jgi:hypothetical protein